MLSLILAGEAPHVPCEKVDLGVIEVDCRGVYLLPGGRRFCSSSIVEGSRIFVRMPFRGLVGEGCGDYYHHCIFLPLAHLFLDDEVVDLK